MSTTVRIVKTPDVLHGKPRIEGTRVGIFEVGELVREQGWSLQDVTREFELDMEEAEAALDYYDEHPELVETLRAEARSWLSTNRTTEPRRKLMQIPCDQNVAAKYAQASENRDEFVVTTVASDLSPDASDDDIVALAATHDWVIFTSDDDFFEHADQCGVLVYNQLSDPPPGDVLDAVVAIDDGYESNRDITEVIPGHWV